MRKRTIGEVMEEFQRLEYERWVEDNRPITIVVEPPDVSMYSGLFYGSTQDWLRDAYLVA